MDRSYLVLDIETVPDADIPWDAARDGFAPPLCHKVVALGALWLEPDLRFRRLGIFGVASGAAQSPAEAKVLTEFAHFVGRARPHLVSYNGRTFNLPVLVNRCLRHGVSFAMYYTDRDYRYRFSELGHLDLANLLTDHGAARKPALDKVARLIGLPGKLDMDGSMVEVLYEQGQIEQIRAYCLQDVVQTAFVFLRCELLRGRIDLDAYRARAGELWATLVSDARVRPVFDAADRDRVLLAESKEGAG